MTDRHNNNNLQYTIHNCTHKNTEHVIQHRKVEDRTAIAVRTDLRSVSAGQVVERGLDGGGGVLQHSRHQRGLAHIDHEEVHGWLRRAHLIIDY